MQGDLGRLIHINGDRRKTRIVDRPVEDVAVRMINDFRSDAELLVKEAERAARSYWPVLLVEGIALILFGVLALIIPPLITIGIASSLGWVFLCGGVAALLVYSRYRTPAFRRRLFLAVSGVIAGLALLIRPFSGVISLTVVLIVCFAVAGAAKITYPLEEARYLWRYRGWVRLSGVVDILLAGLMFLALPETALWAPGILLGTNMILGGVALVATAFWERGRRANSQTDRNPACS